ncbi:endonuclease/exonuclease/phosphatase family protein [Halomonas shantousis]
MTAVGVWGLAISLLVFAFQGWRVMAWTRLWPRQVVDAHGEPAQRCFSLMVANVLTSNHNAKGLTDQILAQDPDMILTLESDQWWQTRLDEALSDGWPHAVRIPLDNLYGMHLYSRLPLEETEVKWLIQEDIPSIHTWVRLRNGQRVRFYAVHPRPPAPSESEESLWRDAELLLVGKAIHQHYAPTLVAGDLNDVAWSRTTKLFCRVSGMLDPRRGRGLFNSFHADYRWLRWPLDHIFVSDHFTLVAMRRLARFGSDHFPIYISLCYRPSRADENRVIEADREERIDATETIAEARSQPEALDRPRAGLK